MESPNEKDQVFHPSSIPVDRTTKQREERQRSYRFCFYTLVIILALFGGLVIVGGGYLTSKFFRGFLFPTKQYALKHKHVDRLNASQVHPLIDASSSFDIHAIVWQDVTDLLARGEQLPRRDEPWKLVETVFYRRIDQGELTNYTRTEAVLFSGRIVSNATLKSKVHISLPLRVPVAPLYTSKLGRSSLRATFNVAIPDDRAKALGSFRNVSHMLSSDNLPFLPRRIDANQTSPDHDLNAALAESGISTSMLELVPSPWYRTDSNGKAAQPTIDNRTAVSPLFSLHHTNLHFLDVTSPQLNEIGNGKLPEFRDDRGGILLPHFRTRTRLGMARSTDVFDNATFRQQHDIGRNIMNKTCYKSRTGFCERPYNRHSFETLLTFAKQDPEAKPIQEANSNDTMELEWLYYAPVLTQVPGPVSPLYQRRIPQPMPSPGGVDRPIALRSNASIHCEIPPASTDTSNLYFLLDWKIYFSSHTLQRVVAAESGFSGINRPAPAPLGPGEEHGKELIANSIAPLKEASYFERFLTGDRHHKDDHPTRFVLVSGAALLWHFLLDEFLLFLFWYTRKSSTGLWIWTGWLWAAVHVESIIVELVRPLVSYDPDYSIPPVVMFFKSLSMIHVFFMAKTLLHLERPAGHDRAKWWKRNPLAFRRRRLTRRERKSIALSDTIDKRPFYILAASIFLFSLVGEHRYFLFSSTAKTCSTDDFDVWGHMSRLEQSFELSAKALHDALLHGHNLAQAWFNYRSGTFTGAFRISAVGTAVLLCLNTLVVALETFSGWADKVHVMPFGFYGIFEMVAPVWLAYQALMYKGVPQVEPAEEDDE